LDDATALAHSLVGLLPLAQIHQLVRRALHCL
jgi:hypothetical protein